MAADRDGTLLIARFLGAAVESVAQLEREGRFDELIETVHEMVAHDRSVMGDDTIKAWSARRWRDLFLQEAVKNERAVDVATRLQTLGLDRRSDRQRVSERFLKDDYKSAWKTEMPAGYDGRIHNTTMVFCPGLANGGVAMQAFDPALANAHRRFGVGVIRADCHPMRGCEANADDVLRAVRDGRGLDADGNVIDVADAEPASGHLMFIGYSKGMPDAMTFLAQHPEYAGRTQVIFGWGGAAGGTPMSLLGLHVARTMHMKDKAVDITMARKMLSHALPSGVDEGITLDRMDDYNLVGALRELTPKVRLAFMEEHRTLFEESEIMFYHVAGATHLWDAPFSQMPLYLRLKRHAPKNDMQLTTIDTQVPYPMATELAMINAHHWDMAFGPFNDRKRFNHLYHPFPTEAACIAMVQLSAELGLID